MLVVPLLLLLMLRDVMLQQNLLLLCCQLRVTDGGEWRGGSRIRAGSWRGCHHHRQLLLLVHLLLQDPSASPPTCSVLLRRAWLTKVSGFVDSFRTLYEDQALYCKLALRAPVLLTNEVWAHYRRHNNSVCAQMYGTAGEVTSRQVFLDWLIAYAPELKV